MLADPRSRRARQQLRRRSGCTCATCRAPSPTARSSRTSTTTCGRRSGARPSCSFDSIIREDRSVARSADADYTFVNERLARHYGIPNVYGSHFRRVTLTDETRRGLLGQGSILTVTSHPNRTSPVLRGKWILENILGTPPPPPPPNVPPLEGERRGRQEPQSVRERLEQHRANPACATCHRGDGPARLRARELRRDRRVAHAGTRRHRSTPSGQLADGTKVDGPVALRQGAAEAARAVRRAR